MIELLTFLILFSPAIIVCILGMRAVKRNIKNSNRKEAGTIDEQIELIEELCEILIVEV